MTTTTSLTALSEKLPPLTRVDGTPIRVLVVDDEQLLADVVALGTRVLGWEARTTNEGYAAIDVAKEWNPDILVLDWMLPGIDGLEVLKRVREFLPQVPVLFLTAKDDVADKIEGLAAGGDDYVTKPFAMEELLLRLHRLIGRSGAMTPHTADLVVGDLVLNVETREVHRGGDLIDLTATQFELLRYLMENAKIVLTREQILNNVWNYDFGGQSNIVELYVSYLRKKIDAGRIPMIHTVRGVGYVIKPTA